MSSKDSQKPERSGLGRPRVPREMTRPHRIVTFVTDAEREMLQRMARDEDRSMAGVVHRIIKTHFED